MPLLQFLTIKQKQHNPHFFGKNKLALIPLCLCLTQLGHTQELSYNDAENTVLKHSYSTQASAALQQAANLNADALKYLALPRVTFNAIGYSFRTESSIPLNSVKDSIKNSFSQGLTNQLSDVQSQLGLSDEAVKAINSGTQEAVGRGVNLIPNNVDVTVKDHGFTPSISMIMPLYTGGLIRTTQKIAQLQSGRSALNDQQQQNIQRFEVIQNYFNVQLQQQLFNVAQHNLNTMQRHLDNAVKLEKQGFISQGQRMQFEVARNTASRALESVQIERSNSLFVLHNLLKQPDDLQLLTPLFINQHMVQDLSSLLQSYPQQSALIQKMQLDSAIAEQNVKLQNVARKPSIYAFGDYGLDKHHNWIVGIAARYNLFSGIDAKKKAEAAEFEHQAVELSTEKSKQEIENILFKAFSSMQRCQKTNALLQQDKQAAQENLRIQNLSFKEGMGTPTQIIDAENALNAIRAEEAMNAYQYILALATLLQSHGSLDQFTSYITLPNTVYIR
ncbi:TolC family protein [Acinetobacter sp. MD2(2019)]|uniref:TolC family protein n=1 Tax=Acinetobacter sp. MD2(2019) TaxID=2605273 RepID=UPI002D1F6051|nr:TolC family protein [Acinetobacter sp. MD2(2019)]MEB3753463.1 TolC family protein [Acinetobacter sp. MD2(2019)]